MAAFAAEGPSARRLAQVSTCAVFFLVAAIASVDAQAPAPQPPAQPAAPQAELPPAQPPEQEQPAATTPPTPSPPPFGSGLIDKLGGLIKDSVDSMSSNLKGTQQ